MAEIVVTKRELENQNADLVSENKDLLAQQASLDARIRKMEKLVSSQQAEGQYVGPSPVLHHDPYDAETNPHHIKKNPDGKILGWKNPNLRNSGRGWRGWTPIQYDDEIGSRLHEYITDPPAKMAGMAEQDNYVRRGTDSILCWIEAETWLARQEKRESKALHKQFVASGARNSVIRQGVETFGDGVQTEARPAGGFKMRENAPPLTGAASHRTEMFHDEEN